MKNSAKELSESEVSRVVEMAWEDRTPFEVIEATFGLSEPETIKLMRRTMKPARFGYGVSELRVESLTPQASWF